MTDTSTGSGAVIQVSALWLLLGGWLGAWETSLGVRAADRMPSAKTATKTSFRRLLGRCLARQSGQRLAFALMCSQHSEHGFVFGIGVHPQFSEDIATVAVARLRTDGEVLGDVCCAHSGGDEAEYFELPVGQDLVRILVRLTGHLGGQVLAKLRAHVAATGLDCPCREWV